MASGSSYKPKKPKHEPVQPKTKIPQRASRKPPEPEEEAVDDEEVGVGEAAANPLHTMFDKVKGLHSRALQLWHSAEIEHMSRQGSQSDPIPTIVIGANPLRALERHRIWLHPLVVSVVLVVISAGVLISAAVMQRPGQPGFVNFLGGQVYSVQVGGNLAGTWQSDTPLPPQVPLPPSSGPYSVLGKPSLTVDFMNQVLANYNSPAAGKGQALYDLGVQYGIDPAFALAFFFHESDFGTAGEARVSFSLGNLRCIPNFKCQDGYAWFPTWEAGFKAWYSLIRNLYVAVWGLTTVDQIIPHYAPPTDNNDDSAYIAALKHSIDTWHAGVIQV